MVSWKHNPCGLMAEPPAEPSDTAKYSTKHFRKSNTQKLKHSNT